MPLKKDAEGKRWVELEFLVPGSPEEVWAAMATGAGNSAWFTQAAIEERVGGKIAFGEEAAPSGTVTIWQPPLRFAYEERAWSGEAPPLDTEIVIAGRAGGKCVVRLVHSLFTASDEWDDQMEGFEAGWPGFIDVLRVYLANFAGKSATALRATASRPGSELEAWTSMIAALNLAGANVGERRETPAGAPHLVGVIERVHQDQNFRQILIRLEQPGDGIALLGSYIAGENAKLAIGIYLYGADAQKIAGATNDEWVDWLDRLAQQSQA
jgi:uncharacterized protein YndB with AHSA1/START domain